MFSYRTSTHEQRRFEPIEASAWSGLATEAASVRAFVGERDTDLYGRFRRWWDKIEIVETRVV